MSVKSLKFNYEEIVIDSNLTLRAVEASEAATLFGLVDGNRDYLSEFLPWVDSTKSAEDSLSFIRTIQKQRENGAEYGFGIYQDGALAGHSSLMHLTDGKPPEIGYWIAKEFSGRGITTKAARAITDFGIETLGLSHIIIKARVDNAASNAIPPKLGYRLYKTTQEDAELLNIWRKDR